jgi:hypothetical protein
MRSPAGVFAIAPAAWPRAPARYFNVKPRALAQTTRRWLAL